MPIKVTFGGSVLLPPFWGDEDEVKELTLEDWIEMFEEDISGLLDEVGV